ncbi:hypothetical protein JNUCC76_04830 [Leuconostoc sp. JNUCC 76]
MIQNKMILSFKYLSISVVFIFCIIYIGATNNTYLGLLGWIITIMFKLLPTIIFGSSLGLVPINELRSIMVTLKVPSEIQMSLIVGIRYFSILNDEFREIKQARLTHGLSLRNPIYYRKPVLIMEYYLIPTLMRTTRLIDDLSIAAFTEGLTVSGKKTSYKLIRLNVNTFIGLLFILLILIVSIFSLLGGF